MPSPNRRAFDPSPNPMGADGDPNTYFNDRSFDRQKCAVRELNPGYWLGKPMSYHWTNGARSLFPYDRTST